MSLHPITANALEVAAAIQRATYVPWIVDVDYQTAGGDIHSRTWIVEAALSRAPEPEAMVPVDTARIVRADVFPAISFDDMRPATRQRYARAYATYLRWQHARARGKGVEQLVPWQDGYDPVLLDERLQRWLTPCVRFAGE